MNGNNRKKLKIVSVLLAAVMMLTVIPFGAFAAGTGKNSANPGAEYPLVILPGINHSVSYLANEDDTPYVNSEGKEISGGILLVDTDGLVMKLLKKMLWPVISSLLLQCDNRLSDAAYDVVCDLLSIQSCDKEGNPTHNLKTESYDYPMSQMDEETKKWFYVMLPIQKVTAAIGEDNVYLYTFPLVGDPMESAEKLVDYIEMVKKQKNVDKVNLATVSLGGTILTAYADIIDGDWSNVNQIINVVSCLNGTDIFADFYAREWNLDADYLYRDYLRQIFRVNNGTETLGCIINGAIRLFSKDTVYALLTGAFSGVLDTLMINDAMFWAMIPRERYDELTDRYISGSDYRVLKKKTDAFQRARLNLEKNLLKASGQGVLINNICGSDLTYNDGAYNFLGIVASSKTSNSDGIVPVYSASIGARTVPAGKEFSPKYIEKADEKYISGFRSIDASSCLFPDHVWFFQKQHHEVGENDAVMELLTRIVTGRIKSINSDREFPQFMGTRYTKTLTRWLLPQAEDVVANEDGKYSDKQVAEVKKAYDEAKALLSDYSVDSSRQEDLDRVINNLDAALVNAGRREAAKSDKFDKAVERMFKFTDDRVFDIYSDNGYGDWTHIGKFNYKVLCGVDKLFNG